MRGPSREGAHRGRVAQSLGVCLLRGKERSGSRAGDRPRDPGVWARVPRVTCAMTDRLVARARELHLPPGQVCGRPRVQLGPLSRTTIDVIHLNIKAQGPLCVFLVEV